MIASICGCIGFAVVANCRGRVLLLSGIGGFLVWTVYLRTLEMADGNYFTATPMAACGAAVFGNIASLIIKTPPTVFTTTCIMPVIPGSTLYLLVYAIIMDDRQGFHQYGRKLFLICIAIALGYIIVEMVFKYLKLSLALITASGERKKSR